MRMRSPALYALTFLLAFLIGVTASVSSCDRAAIPSSKTGSRNFVRLIKSTAPSLPQKDNTVERVSGKAATHAPAIQISVATIAIVIGLVSTSHSISSSLDPPAGLPVPRLLLLRSAICPNAP